MRTSLNSILKPFRWPQLFLSVIFYILGTSVSTAQSTNKTTMPVPTETTTIRSRIENTHTIVSDKIISVSLRLDSILGYDKIEDEKPDSQVRVRMMSTSDSLGTQRFKTRINTKLSLPRTQKRLHLFINNLEDEHVDDEIETAEEHVDGAHEDIEETLKGEEFAAGIRQMLLTERNFHVHADAGVRFRVPLDPYLRLKARQSIQPNGFATHFTQHAFAYQHSGYGYDLGVSFDRPLGYDYHLRQSNLAAYTDTNRYYKIQHAINLIQPLKRKRSMVYFVSTTGITKPTLHATSYNFGVTYRTPVGWPWMVLEVTPMMNYPRTHNFVANPGITLQLETTFGMM